MHTVGNTNTECLQSRFFFFTIAFWALWRNRHATVLREICIVGLNRDRILLNIRGPTAPPACSCKSKIHLHGSDTTRHPGCLKHIPAHWHVFWIDVLSANMATLLWQLIYTGCHRRNGPKFGRVFLMLNYTDITQNTCIQS